MATITIQVDLPPDVTITSYARYRSGHGFEISWPLPSRCRCERCHYEDESHLEYKNGALVVRDLDIWGQPSFWIYQPVYHRCANCHHRQHLIPPFKRKDVTYTYRFEKHVLGMLIGSTEEEVARRLGISAETVALIVRHQLADGQDKQVDAQRRITDLGIDDLSLKKGHKLSVTILTDLSDPEHLEVLAVAEGRDEAAARQCLEKLTPEQRQGVRTYRADMSQAYHNACKSLLPQAKPVVDRFHVAKNFNAAIDRQRQNITRSYKAKLSKTARQEFRSRMWHFRRHPKDLTVEQEQELEELFRQLPPLRRLYEIRVRFQEIFDTSPDRQKAHRALLELFLAMLEEFPELERFIGTFETWQEEILNYFDARQTSGAVEGINNKARVIIKRSYGLKAGDSLWNRLVLDLNRAKEVVKYTLRQIKELVLGFRTLFSPACT
jgi:transposase